MSVDMRFIRSRATLVGCAVRAVRKTLIALAAIVSMPTSPVALAQDQTTPHRVDPVMASSDEQEFIIDSELAVSKMSLEMSADPTGDVDRDFVAMMVPHAQGAIDVARAELKYGHSEYLRRIAQGIIADRESEISGMRSGVGISSREHH